MLHPRRVSCLRWIYNNWPFNLKGDLSGPLPPMIKGKLSCLIPSKQPHLLSHLLEDLQQQDIPKDLVEIIPIKANDTRIGYLRNLGLLKSQGEFILFLDDDTRIFQQDFLTKALTMIQESNCDTLIPHAKPLFCYSYSKNQYLKPFAFATRCCLIRRSALEKINGFRNLYSFEDTELRIRLELSGCTLRLCKELEFFHPPYESSSWQKPLSLAHSILSLRKVYPFYIWVLIYLNQFSLAFEKNRLKHALSLIVCLLMKKKRHEYTA